MPTPTQASGGSSPTPTPTSNVPVVPATALANQTPTATGQADIVASNDPPGGSSPGSPWTNGLVYLLLFIILSAGAALVFVVRKTHIFG